MAGARAMYIHAHFHPALVSYPSVHTDVDAHMENVTAGKRGGEHRPQTDVEDHKSQWRSKEKHYLHSLLALLWNAVRELSRFPPKEEKTDQP